MRSARCGISGWPTAASCASSCWRSPTRTRALTYCLLEAPLPLMGYVATMRLKPVTDGDRTFWEWRSRVPPAGASPRRTGRAGARRHLSGRLRGRSADLLATRPKRELADRLRDRRRGGCRPCRHRASRADASCQTVRPGQARNDPGDRRRALWRAGGAASSRRSRCRRRRRARCGSAIRRSASISSTSIAAPAISTF